MNKKFLDLEKQFDVEGNMSVMLQIDTELIRQGILTSLKPTELKVLIAVASHMDDEGECFPSQRYISDVTGVAFSTVTKTINSLLAVRITDLPVMTRKITGTGARKKSVYSFNIDTENPAIEVERNTSKFFIDMYYDKYLECYGAKYKVSGQKDSSSIKSMMEIYTDKEMEDIISTVITEYPKRWSKPQYPAPTIGAMSSWLCVQAMQIISNRAKVDTSWDDCENDEDLIL